VAQVVPLGFMFFCILFNYTILRDTKDVLVVTAPGSGAEIIPFLKTWCACHPGPSRARAGSGVGRGHAAVAIKCSLRHWQPRLSPLVPHAPLFPSALAAPALRHL
jgi:hypothetical protein